jgi:hypothetical protein
MILSDQKFRISIVDIVSMSLLRSALTTLPVPWAGTGAAFSASYLTNLLMRQYLSRQMSPVTLQDPYPDLTIANFGNVKPRGERRVLPKLIFHLAEYLRSRIRVPTATVLHIFCMISTENRPVSAVESRSAACQLNQLTWRRHS